MGDTVANSDPIHWTQARRRLDELTPWPRNPRQIKLPQAKRLLESVQEFGQVETLAIGPDGDIYNGHQRLAVLMERYGPDYEVDVRVSSRPLSEKEREKLTVYLHRGATGEWNFDTLANEFEVGELIEWGFEPFELGLGGDDGNDTPDKEEARATLADRFIVPPFSVLDARQGYWQDRKRAWLALGLRGELGRGDKLTFGDAAHRQMAHKKGGLIQGGISGGDPKFYQLKRAKEKELGRALSTTEFRVEHYTPEDSCLYSKESGRTSVMDPVLCELAYRWFCPQEGHVINPTAGESVYGIVAGYLGYTYEGVELRAEQIADNEQQAVEIGVSDKVKWINGDGRNTAQLVEPADLIMCCPPYHDLEVYSDAPQDISTLDDYSEFLEAYRLIVTSAVDALKPDRFACFVVGDIRDKRGHYRNFVSDTIGAFRAAGCELYNEAIFVTPAGSLPIRTPAQFTNSRKLGKTHQNVLIFIKGDWRKAVEACGPVTVEVPDGFGTNNDNDN